MELVERAYGLSVFDVHVRACRGALPAFNLATARRRAPEAVGKAILYARREVVMGDPSAWLADADLRDISPSGTRYVTRDPICTIFARGRSAASCLASLASRATGLYRDLERREPRIA